MPYNDHLRLTCSGSIGAGFSRVERFSFRLNLSAAGATDVIFTEARAIDYAADAVAFFARSDSAIGTAAFLEEVKLAKIGPDGKYVADPFIVPVSQNGQGNGGMLHPPQVALAVSLNSDRRGATGKGRFYLPLPALAVGAADGLVAPLSIDLVQASVVTFINDLNNVAGADPLGTPRVTVASLKGYNSDVTSVRVGRALDTIRSRRTSLPESYAASSPVTAN